MNRIDKFRGLLEIQINGEPIILNSLNVNDLFDLLLLQKMKDDQFLFGVNLLTRILTKSFPEEEPFFVEQFVIDNYQELIEEIIIALEWTTRAQLEKIKKEAEKPKDIKQDKKRGIAAFKAKLSKQVDADEIEDKYITAAYVLMREFKYTNKYILEMPATIFLLLLDEMNKQAEREKEELNKNKTMKKK